MITIFIFMVLSLVQSKQIAQAQASIHASKQAINASKRDMTEWYNEQSKKAFNALNK